MVLTLLSLLLGIALAVTGSFTFWQVQSGLDFYKPLVLLIAGYVAGILLFFIIVGIFDLTVNTKKEYEKPSKIAKILFIQALELISIHCLYKTKVTGLNKVPHSGNFLLVCNHRSNFDPIIIGAKFKKYQLAFISKISNLKMPLVGKLIWAQCFMPIDRKDPLQSLSVIKRSSSLIQNGISSVGVFPEGTRHKDGVLGEFHEGVFNIAMRINAPIIVTALSNTNSIAKNKFKITKCRLDVLKVIDPSEYNGKTAKEISEMSRVLIDEHLNKIEGK